MSDIDLSHQIPESTLAQGQARSNHLTNRGLFFHQSRAYADALNFYQEALQLNPRNARVHFLIGQIHHTLHDYPIAKTSYEKAIVCDPKMISPLTALAKLSLETFDWNLFNQTIDQLPQPLPSFSTSSELYHLITTHKPELIKPLKLQSSWDSLVTQQTKPHLKYFSSQKLEKPSSNLIRIGYLTSQAHHSHIGRQLLSLINNHDRDKFEVFVFSTSAQTGDSLESVLEAKSDHYISKPGVDIPTLTSLIRHSHINILVHLDDRLQLNSSGALDLKAAPIQIHYPGLFYSSFSNHLNQSISDRYLKINSPKTTNLKPTWYLTTPLPFPDPDLITRIQIGLPQDKFIFSSFVSPDHIDPSTFKSWLHILTQVQNSAIYLAPTHPQTQSNLQQLASASDISPERIIFAAPSKSDSNHLYRLSLTDLYLESPYINDHHLSSLALHLDLPVITIEGNTPQTRATASLLKSAGLDKLVTKNPSSYQELAIKLASHPKDLEKLKTTIKKLELPFFDPNTTLPQYESSLQHIFSKAHQ